MPKPGDSWFIFKKLVLLHIEEHPGVRSGDLIEAFNADDNLIMECLDVLLSQGSINWIEEPRMTWRYYASRRPTAWEVLLQDDVV